MIKKKKSFLNTFMSLINLVAKAETATMSTATETGISGQAQLSDAVRVVYSKEIQFKQLPLMRFTQFAKRKTELNVEPGLTISMMTYNNLKLGGKLKEGVKMTSQALSSTMKQITVGERGNAVSVSELLLQSSFDDIMASTTYLLARDSALVIDCELRDAAFSGTNVIYASKKDGTKITARKDLTEDCIFKVSTVKDGLEILATNNAPKFAGQDWICFVHPHQSRNLRDDSAWINAANYGAPTQLFTGEIGKIDDTRFIETTILNNGAAPEDDFGYDSTLKKGATSGEATLQTNVFKSVIFGDEYFGWAISLPVELRDAGVLDYGREHGLAWYGIWGAGVLNDGHGVVIETA